VVPSVPEGRRDIVCTEAPRDHRRPPIDERVEATTGRVVWRICRTDDTARERAAQLVQSLEGSFTAPFLLRGHARL
jgi:hypothetical protein